jgi:hypothetical protein
MTDGFDPVTREDVTDEALVAGELRALRNEMRSWFELMLNRLDRYEQRIHSLEIRSVDDHERLLRHEHRIAALEASHFKPGDKP